MISKGYRLSDDKTVAVHFHRKRGMQTEPSITLNNKQVKFRPHTKFLGLVVDQKLNWKEHIDQLKDKATKAMYILKCVSHFDWGADRTTLFRLYHSLIRSKIDYGSQVYSSAAECILNKLTPVHNQAIRICTGAFKSSPIVSLYAESGEMSLHHRRMQLSLQHYIRIKQLPNSPVYNALTSNEIHNNTSNRTFNERIRSSMEELHLPQMNVLPFSTPLEPPWLLPSELICTDQVVPNKNEYNKNITRMLFEDHIRTQHSDSIHVFTDGSKSNEGVGCAFIMGNNRQGFKLSAQVTIYSTELHAILRC